jgi:ketosteroid isomerase-like protein
LTAKHNFLWPDLDADRLLYDALVRGDYATWRAVTTADIEASGQQEMLNWFCLAGAMQRLGRTASSSALVETALYNSNKCFAIFSGS